MIACALVRLACLCLAAAPCDGAPSVQAFVHANVVPMDVEKILPDRTVLVRGGRIAAIGPADLLAPPEGAVIIEARGRWLLPGLADMHVHVWNEKEFPLFLANGVTSVRNMWGTPLHLEWRRRAEAGSLLAPTVYSTGVLMDGDPPVWPSCRVLTTPEEARQAVAEQRAAGFRDLKVYNRLALEVYETIVEEARASGMRVVGHVPDAVGLAGALAARQASIEHLTGYLMAIQEKGSPALGMKGIARLGPAADHADESRIPEVVEATRAAGTWNCVTLVVLDRISASPEERARLLAAPEMRYVSPATRGSWDPSEDFRLKNLGPKSLASMRRATRLLRAVTRALHEAGARILLGTDTPNPLVVPGFALHDELRNLVGAGFSPYDAIRAGTADAAEFLGESGEFGVVRVGARADLILVEGNPLDDVANLKRRAGVMVRGRWLPEARLHEMLEEVARSYAPRDDPFEGRDPLPGGGRGEVEAEGSFVLLMGKTPVGHERIAFERLAGGRRVLHAQLVMTAFGDSETRVRLVPGEDGTGSSMRVELRTPSGRSSLAVERRGEHLSIRGSWGGREVNRDEPIAAGQILAPPSVAATVLLARRLASLEVGGEMEIHQKSIGLYPSLTVGDLVIRARRMSDPPGGGVGGGRLYTLEGSGSEGKFHGRLATDAAGRPISHRIESSMGTYEIRRE